MTLKRNGTLLGKKFNEYLLPTILSAMSILLASFVDGIIVSKLIDPDALSAVNLAEPVILFFQALFFLFGIGGLISISRALGERNSSKANSLFTLAIVGAVIASVVVTAAGTLFKDGIVSLICNEQKLTQMVGEYVSYSIYGSSFIIIVPTFVFIMRVDGMPKFSSAVLIVSNAVNLIMDIVYIKVFDMGIKGAALATVTGYAVGALMVLYYLCIYKKRTLRFVKPGAAELKNIAELCTSGISSVLNTLLLFIKAILLNRIVINAGGADAISAFSVCNFLLTFISMFVSGGADTMTPIVSMLSGEKDHKGISIILRKTFVFVLCCCAAVIAIICLFPETVLALFSVKSESKLAMGVPAVRIFSLSLIGMGISYIMMNYFQSVKHKPLSIMITLLRGIVMTVPLAYAMSKLFGVKGIWWSLFISEMLTAAAAFAVSFIIYRTKKDKYSSVFLFEKAADNGAVYDVSLDAQKRSAVKVSEDISTFCLENSVSEQKAKYAGLLAEEAVEHIRRFNTEKVPQIDLFCKVLDDRIILSVRDNGAIFDPANVRDDTEEFSNLKMIGSVADKVDYTRVIGLNNMLVELGR
ncbi:MAG: hypothetical protein IKH90_09275 [Ruminococcus sp.]|nr:hypothetical protein [Ruminococcus sp.]